jgi:hypothetical protein
LAARVLLALTATLIIAWVGVLLRNYEVGREAVIQRDPEGIESAQLLDPNAYWDQVRASVYLLNGDPRRAAETAEVLVHDEPQNPVAWAVLRAATRGIDPSRSEGATAELRRLNPLTAP